MAHRWEGTAREPSSEGAGTWQLGEGVAADNSADGQGLTVWPELPG